MVFDIKLEFFTKGQIYYEFLKHKKLKQRNLDLEIKLRVSFFCRDI